MTDRNAYIAGLRQLADVLENHPEVPLPFEGNGSEMTFHFLGGDDPKGAMAATARALPTTFTKDVRLAGYFDMYGVLAGGLKIKLTAFRNDVCERVVTGTREVEVTEPDPDALAKVPTVTKTVTVEDVVWECSPVLAPAGDKAAK